MRSKKYKLIFLLLAVVCYGKAQTISRRMKLKLDSLYPKATYLGGNSQVAIIKCNCAEFEGEMNLIFDTDGTITGKEYQYNSINDLPHPILKYIQKNSSSSISFSKDEMWKGITKKGQVYYLIFMKENGTPYELKMTSSGKLFEKTCLLGTE